MGKCQQHARIDLGLASNALPTFGRREQSSVHARTSIALTALLSPSSHLPLKACFLHHTASVETPTQPKHCHKQVLITSKPKHSLGPFFKLVSPIWKLYLRIWMWIWQTYKERYLCNSGCLKQQQINMTSSTLVFTFLNDLFTCTYLSKRNATFYKGALCRKLHAECLVGCACKRALQPIKHCICCSFIWNIHP